MNTKRLSAATYGHLSIDIINASVAMILVLVGERWSLSISQIGFGAMVYQLFAAMSQPLFGSVTDRLGGRWVGAVGLAWTLIFYSLASLMPSYPLFITVLMVGGLGSGAFHAAGLLNSSVSGGAKPATATSIFFVGGQVGLALGPIIIGFLLPRFGIQAMPLLALCMAPAVLAMLLLMNDALPAAVVKPKAHAEQAQAGARLQLATVVMITAFILYITIRSGTSQTFSTLLPKYYFDLGIPTERIGSMIGIFAFAGAMGTLTGGFLGDRFSRRAILFASPIIGVPFLWFMLHSAGALFVVSSALAGFFVSMPHSIILVLSQEIAGNKRGLVGGLVLGFMFASGSTVAWLASIAADSFGLAAVLSLLAIMPLAAGFISLLLPTRGKVVAPVDPAAPAAAVPLIEEPLPDPFAMETPLVAQSTSSSAD